MKITSTSGLRRKSIIVVTCVFAAAVFWNAGITGSAQTQPVSLPPGVQDIVNLAHAGMSEEVILAQVKHARASYNLSADQIIHLSNQGVSQTVIKALLSGNGPIAPASPTVPPARLEAVSPAPAASAPVPAPPAVSQDYFHDQLALYGTWVQVDGYGSCWRPLVAADPAWRPYCDQGHWVYASAGWSWQSDYPWGEIAFHYGRWFRDDRGWAWVPAYDWAPAWVSWRRSESYCGWAPLPPSAVFKAGAGLSFGGQVTVDADFGLGAGEFTFVAYDHFWDHDFRPVVLPRDRVELVFRASMVMNGYRIDHGRFVVEGLGRENIAIMTHHEVVDEAPAFHDSRMTRPLEEGGRGRRGMRPEERNR